MLADFTSTPLALLAAAVVTGAARGAAVRHTYSDRCNLGRDPSCVLCVVDALVRAGWTWELALEHAERHHRTQHPEVVHP